MLPVQRGNVAIQNIDFLNAILYIAENGCKWRKIPEQLGAWFIIYRRMRRWADKGVWPRFLDALQTKLPISLDVTALSLDSISIKVHPDGTEALKNGTPSHRQKSRRSKHQGAGTPARQQFT